MPLLISLSFFYFCCNNLIKKQYVKNIPKKGILYFYKIKWVWSQPNIIENISLWFLIIGFFHSSSAAYLLQYFLFFLHYSKCKCAFESHFLSLWYFIANPCFVAVGVLRGRLMLTARLHQGFCCERSATVPLPVPRTQEHAGRCKWSVCPVTCAK